MYKRGLLSLVIPTIFILALLAVPAAAKGSANSQAGGSAQADAHRQNATAPHGNATGQQSSSGERDVPGASVDPSKKDTDNGKGNGCDPGHGGAINGNGNFGRYPEQDGDDTTGTNCDTSTGSGGGGGGGDTGGTGGTGGGGGGDVGGTGTGGGGTSGTSDTGGAVLGISTGPSGVGGGTGAGAVLGVSTAPSGVHLAFTGWEGLVSGLAGLLLVIGGAFLLMRRRPETV